jgi:uncharacterized protein
MLSAWLWQKGRAGPNKENTMAPNPNHAVVWAEIPVTDLPRGISFYRTLTGQDLMLDETGPDPIMIFAVADMKTGVSGHLYPGKPARSGEGPRVHLAMPDKIEAAMARCTAAGGKVLSPIIEIPAGRFAYAEDPDGNSISLFEPKG